MGCKMFNIFIGCDNLPKTPETGCCCCGSGNGNGGDGNGNGGDGNGNGGDGNGNGGDGNGNGGDGNGNGGDGNGNGGDGNGNGGDGNGNGGDGNGNGGDGNGNGGDGNGNGGDGNGNGGDDEDIRNTDDDPGKALVSLLGTTNTDAFVDVETTKDGYVAFGSSGSASLVYGWYDTDLNLLNQTTVTLNNFFEASCIRSCENGQVVATGSHGYSGGNPGYAAYRDAFIMTLDETENTVQAQKRIGYFNCDSPSLMGYGIAKAPRGFTGSASYVTVGLSPSGQAAAILSLDKEFNVLKQTCISGSGIDIFRDVLITKNKIIAVGQSNSASTAGGNDGLICVFDDTLNIQKSIMIGTTGEDSFTSIKKLEDGYLVAGTSNDKALVLIFDEEMQVVSKGQFFGSEIESLTGAAIDTKGRYVITGTTTSAGAGSTDVFVIAANDEMEIEKELVWGGAGAETAGRSIIVQKDGTYTIVGGTASAGAGGSDAFIVSFSGQFKDLTGTLGKYPALRINGKPGFESSRDFSLTYNDKTTLEQKALTFREYDLDAAQSNPSDLIVDPNAVTEV